MENSQTPKLWLRGIFRLTNAHGAELEIQTNKAKALVALLATSPNGARSRLWLQSKLWSDRAPEQASGSLRQALSKLRRVLEGSGILISASRIDVKLDLSSVLVVDEGTGDFLEGIDVRDEGFEGWLTTERAAREAGVQAFPQSGRQQQSRVNWRVCLYPQAGETSEVWFETLFSDAVARSLRESFNTAISVAPRRPDQGEAAEGLLAISTHAHRDLNTLYLRVVIEETAARTQIWSAARTLPLRGGPPIEHPEVLAVVCEMGDAILQYIRANEAQLGSDDPDVLALQAIDHLFSIDRNRVDQADQLFAKAHASRPRGLYLAWQAQLRTVQVVERFTSSPEALAEEARELAAHALELEPLNSMVSALAANVAGHLDRDIERSIELGLRSVRLNPANPMSGNSLSSGHLYSQELELSYAQASSSRNLALLSRHRFWWDQQLFGSSFVMGKLEEAYRLARTAHALNPNFRPSLRYLIALSVHFRDQEAAVRYTTALQSLEPDFSIERLLGDEEYPASLIRRAPGLDLSQMHDLKGI